LLEGGSKVDLVSGEEGEEVKQCFTQFISIFTVKLQEYFVILTVTYTPSGFT
jgi:hypothetical protein